jgi:hypothetical protein
MPSGPRIDPLSSALSASKRSAYLRNHNCFRQHVHVHVGFVAASLTGRDNGMDTVLAHIRENHGRPGFFTRNHA